MQTNKLPRWTLGLAALAVVAAAAWYATSGNNSPAQTAFSAGGLDQDSIVNAASHSEPRPDLFIGDADAPIEVIEYASYTCPHCANFHRDVYPQLKENFIDTGKVKFVFREVYFDKFGLWAGMLARCNGDERYFGLVDMLMKRQDEWARGGNDGEIISNMFRLGRQTGMTDDQMNTCVRDNDLAQALVADFQLKAGQDQVSATPTFIVNGEKMSNMSYDNFAEALNDRLK